MKLTFRIEYRTAWGEELGVILDGNNSEPIILRTPNGEHWEGAPCPEQGRGAADRNP